MNVAVRDQLARDRPRDRLRHRSVVDNVDSTPRDVASHRHRRGAKMDDGMAVGCCDNKLVTGGTFPMGRCGWARDGCSETFDGDEDEMPEHDATVADFRLDTF